MKTLKSVLQNIAGILQTVYSFFMLLGGGWIFLIFIERWTPEEALLFLFSLSSLGIGISSAILADSLIGGRKNPDEAFREEVAPSRGKVGSAQGAVEQPQKEVMPSREESEPFQKHNEKKHSDHRLKRRLCFVVSIARPSLSTPAKRLRRMAVPRIMLSVCNSFVHRHSSDGGIVDIALRFSEIKLKNFSIFK